MEANKFEKHIAEKMKEREIQPSPDAWEKISKRLEILKTSKKSGYLWYGIAASAIGLLIISVLFFNQDSTPNVPEIVETPKTNKEDVLKKELPIPQSPDELVFDQEADNKEKDASLDYPIIEAKELVINEVKNNQDISSDTIEDEVISDKNTEELLIADAVVEAKITELLAQVDILEENSISLTDAEVDSLLRKAQQEIVIERVIGNNGSVNAMALLSEVEEELDQSFRDQIFDKLKSGFQKVRTAVADRNN